MDLAQCVEILNNRQRCENSDCLKCVLPPAPSSSSALPTVKIEPNELFYELTLLELLDIMLAIQRDRVQTYASYDQALARMITESKIGEYPHLCAEVTSIFSVLSKQAIQLKIEFERRNESCLVRIIQDIQNLEKEKLTVVAAIHLDTIKQGMDLLQTYAGPDDNESVASNSNMEWFVETTYKAKRVEELNANIAELTIELQAYKADGLS